MPVAQPNILLSQGSLIAGKFSSGVSSRFFACNFQKKLWTHHSLFRSSGAFAKRLVVQTLEPSITLSSAAINLSSASTWSARDHVIASPIKRTAIFLLRSVAKKVTLLSPPLRRSLWKRSHLQNRRTLSYQRISLCLMTRDPLLPIQTRLHRRTSRPSRRLQFLQPFLCNEVSLPMLASLQRL